MLNTPNQENKREKCYACGGKGTYSQIHGIEGFEDFGGEGFIETPSVHNYPCSACNGTGFRPQPIEEEKCHRRGSHTCNRHCTQIDCPKCSQPLVAQPIEANCTECQFEKGHSQQCSRYEGQKPFEAIEEEKCDHSVILHKGKCQKCNKSPFPIEPKEEVAICLDCHKSFTVWMSDSKECPGYEGRMAFYDSLPHQEVIKNGLIGEFGGYRKGGKTYDLDGNIIDEVHEEDCFCCRKILLQPHQEVKCTCIKHNNGGEECIIVNECPVHDELFGNNATPLEVKEGNKMIKIILELDEEKYTTEIPEMPEGCETPVAYFSCIGDVLSFFIDKVLEARVKK